MSRDIDMYEEYARFLVWAIEYNRDFPELTKKMLRTIKHVM